MGTKSAGILLYRFKNHFPEVLLVHPGGPFWAKKDLNSWSIPKGEFTDEEDPLHAAIREFEEETGTPVSGNFIKLTPVRQKSGKLVYCYACEGDVNPTLIRSNTFEMEWPPKSGKKQLFPEIDRGEWFKISEGKRKINELQAALIDELVEKLNLPKE
jgi:predicted NUDIX family NTP pyrophosphohydrolase